MAIEDMTTDEFRERLKERVLRQEEATDESSVRVQEMLKSIDRLSDERIKNLQDMESMSKNLEERDNKFEGGSMLVPPEREQYSLGGALTKLGKLKHGKMKTIKNLQRNKLLLLKKLLVLHTMQEKKLLYLKEKNIILKLEKEKLKAASFLILQVMEKLHKLIY